MHRERRRGPSSCPRNSHRSIRPRVPSAVSILKLTDGTLSPALIAIVSLSSWMFGCRADPGWRALCEERIGNANPVGVAGLHARPAPPQVPFSTAGDRQCAEAQHGRERVDHLRLIGAGPGCSLPGSRRGVSGVPPRATGRGRRPTRSGHHRRRRSPSCIGRLAARRGERYRRSWPAWQIRCSERKTPRQRIPTRWQRLTLRPPPRNQTRHE